MLYCPRWTILRFRLIQSCLIAICHTFVKPTKFVVNPFSVDDCAEVVGSSFTSTKYTQTVSTIRKTSLEKIVSNPHPDIVQEVLSKKKEKKPQLFTNTKSHKVGK